MKRFERQLKVKISIILLLIFLAFISILLIDLFKFRTIGEIVEIKDEIYFMQVHVMPPRKDDKVFQPKRPYEYPFARNSYDEKFVLSEEIGESLISTLLNTKVQRDFFNKTNDSLETETDRLQIVIWRDMDSFYAQDTNFDYIDIYIESPEHIRIFPYKWKEWDLFYNVKVHKDDADIIQVISELLNSY